MKTSNSKSSLIKALENLSLLCKREKSSLTLKEIIEVLSHGTLLVLIIIFALPFCLPAIPGMSTFFGIVLIYLSISFLLEKKIYLPKWLLSKEITCTNVEKMVQTSLKIGEKIRKVFHHRISFLSSLPAKKIHGILLLILSLCLAFPIPIPLINIIAAIPIVTLAWGMLEEDGLLILLSYVFSALCIEFYVELIITSWHLI